jgi:hypothetical protein
MDAGSLSAAEWVGALPSSCWPIVDRRRFVTPRSMPRHVIPGPCLRHDRTTPAEVGDVWRDEH